MRAVKKEFIVMDLDDNDEDVRCGKVKEEYMMDAEQINSSTDSGKTNPSNMQRIVSAVASDDDDDEDDDWGTKIDYQYIKLLDSFREDGTSNLSDNPLRSIRYEVDNGGYDKREFKANKRSREDRNTIRVTMKNVEPKPPNVQANTEKVTKEAGFKLRRRESLVSEKSVEAMLITSHVRRTSQHTNGHNSEKENLEDLVVLDEGYRSYLTWLVENSKSSRTNLKKKIQVKCEEDYTMSLSDSDSDIIVVGDRPFQGEEDSPFVPSKSYKVVDLDEPEATGPQTGEARRSPRGYRSGTPGLKARLISLCASDRKSCASNGQGSEAPAPRLKAQTKPPSALPRLALFKTQDSSDQHNSWFRKEIMNVLKQPYTVTELKELHNEASVHRVSSRHIELRDGREFSFPTNKKTPSYLDGYPDFKKQYLESLREDDEHKALNLLRGFIFYLTNVVRDDAFKPWLDQECLKIRCF